ncbi:hypothetical protein [Corynebacterium tapiri]|uniref:Tryptophan-rich sensory protein n=1 Tax=Corynebacterium tapiri TaxID=1448266 RepID=A0A5C4U7R0_9CORY|nr:hypothetical protein [Corynebacterium tapiri]TNM00411.1 hypothetical protein FHE74_00200 [Corynebacterium tapiri]
MTRPLTAWPVPLATFVSTLVTTAAVFIGYGFLSGTSMVKAAQGILSADASYFAPALTAFDTWGFLHLMLLVYAVWQLTPAARRSSVQEEIRPRAITAFALHAVWVWAFQLEALWVSLFSSVATLLTLLSIMRIVRTESRAWHTLLSCHCTFGAYLGWTLVEVPITLFQLWSYQSLALAHSEWCAAAAITLLTATSMGLSYLNRGRLVPAIFTAWPVGAIAAARLTGTHESLGLVALASMATLAILASPVVIRLAHLTLPPAR